MGGGMDGFPHISAQVNGNRNVVCLNRNDAKRNLNLNNRDDDWNDNWRFLGVRYGPRFSPDSLRGVFCIICRRQPPSIRPISTIYSER